MNLNRFIGKLFAGIEILKSNVHPSFSQAGEDQVIRYLFTNHLGIQNPTYLDIGTNHPIIGNNTFYFYNRGGKGVCIEPDVNFKELIKKHRKRDTLLLAGIGIGNETEADLYIFPGKYSGWNTFSKEEAESREQQTGIKISAVKKVSLLNINHVIKNHFQPYPNLLSIDVEGWDLAILKELDFEQFKPEVICVETITFSTSNKEQKIPEIVEFILSKGYFVFADTHINTIFCRTDSFKNKTS